MTVRTSRPLVADVASVDEAWRRALLALAELAQRDAAAAERIRTELLAHLISAGRPLSVAAFEVES